MKRFSLLLLFAFSAVPLSAQSISGELPVSAPQLTAADLAQVTPAVATDGELFLAVWQNSLIDGGGIFATRVSRDGVLLDQTPIRFAGPPEQGERPQVAWTGRVFVVVWLNGSDVRATTISRDGEVTGDRSIGTGREPSVSCAAAQCLAAWSDGTTNASNESRVVARFLDADGNPLLQIPAFPLLPGRVGLVRSASNGRNFLVAWQQQLDPFAPRVKLYTASVGLDGRVESVQTVSVIDNGLAQHAVASEGSRYLLTWVALDVQHDRVEAQVFDDSGRPSGTPKVLDASGEIGGLVNLVRSGGGYLIFINRSSGTATLQAFRVTADGTLVDPAPAHLAGDFGSSDRIAVAASGARTLVVWPRLPGPGHDTDIYGAFVDSPPAAVQASFLVSRSAARQLWPALAGDSERVLSVWSESSPASLQLRAVTFLPNGLRGEVRTVHPSAVDQFRPAVAFNGSEYLVVWREGGRNAPVATVMAKRLNRSGAPIEGSEIVLTSDGCGFYTGVFNNAVAAASDGRDFAVAWQDCSGRRLLATRISGGVADGPSVVAATGSPNRLDLGGLAWGGEHYLLTWIDVRPVQGLCGFNCTIERVHAARLNRAATVVGAQPLEISPLGARPLLSGVVWDGAQFAVFWSEGQKIQIGRVSPDGAISAPVAVASANGYASAVAATFDGASIGMTWLDQASTFTFKRGDIRMARIGFDGRPSSPPFLVAGSTDDELAPAIAAFGPGAFALGYQRITHEREYGGANRVFVRLVSGCPAVTVHSVSPAAEIVQGKTVTLTAIVSGATAFQWYRGASGTTTSPLPGMTTASINVTPAVTTSYWVRASNGCTFADSATVTVTVQPCHAPAITTQPRDTMVVAGGYATLSVAATGTALSYQWYQGAMHDVTRPIPGANSPALTTGPVTAATQFWVRVTGQCGAVDSAAAKVSLVGRRRAAGP